LDSVEKWGSYPRDWAKSEALWIVKPNDKVCEDIRGYGWGKRHFKVEASKLSLWFHIVLEVQANVTRTRTEMKSKTFAYCKREKNPIIFRKYLCKNPMRISWKNVGIDESPVRSLHMK
jgi:hypothetical protein